MRTLSIVLSRWIWEPSQSYSVGGYEKLLNRTQLADMRTLSIVLSWWIWEPSQSYSVGGYENLLNRTRLVDMRTFSIVRSWWIWEPSQSYSVGGYENPLNRSCQLITRKLDSRPSLVNCVESTTLFYCRRRTKSGCIVATTKHQIFRPYQVLYEYPLAVRCCSISS